MVSQHLMLSTKLPETQILFVCWEERVGVGREGVGVPNLPKIQIPHVCWGMGEGGRGGVPTFDAECKTAQNPYSLYIFWGGGGFPTFDSESKTD